MLRKSELNRHKKQKIDVIDEVDVYLHNSVKKSDTIKLSQHRLMEGDDSKFCYCTHELGWNKESIKASGANDLVLFYYFIQIILVP